MLFLLNPPPPGNLQRAWIYVTIRTFNPIMDAANHCPILCSKVRTIIHPQQKNLQNFHIKLSRHFRSTVDDESPWINYEIRFTLKKLLHTNHKVHTKQTRRYHWITTYRCKRKQKNSAHQCWKHIQHGLQHAKNQTLGNQAHNFCSKYSRDLAIGMSGSLGHYTPNQYYQYIPA